MVHIVWECLSWRIGYGKCMLVAVTDVTCIYLQYPSDITTDKVGLYGNVTGTEIS